MDEDIHTSEEMSEEAVRVLDEVDWICAQIPDILTHYMIADTDDDTDGLALMGSALHSLVDRLSERIQAFCARRP